MPAFTIKYNSTLAQLNSAFAGQIYPVNVLIASTSEDKDRLPIPNGIIEPAHNSTINSYEQSIVVSIKNSNDLALIFGNAMQLLSKMPLNSGFSVETTASPVSAWGKNYVDIGSYEVSEWPAGTDLKSVSPLANGLHQVGVNLFVASKGFVKSLTGNSNHRKRLGSSIDSFGFRDQITINSPTSTQTSANSILRAANVELNQRFELVNVGGITGSQILDAPGVPGFLSRLPGVLAQGVEYAYLPNTVNNDKDTPVILIADEIAAYQQAFDLCWAAGVTPITTTKFPSYSISTAEEREAVNTWNNWVLGECRRNGVLVADVSYSCADPASLTYQANPNAVEKTGGVINNQNVHRNFAGTVLDGKAIAASLANVIDSWEIPWLYTYDATNTGGRNSMIKNPIMAGISGTKGTATTGDVSDSWNISANAGDSAVCSKIARKDTAASWQQVVWTPAAGATTLLLSTAGGAQRWGLGNKAPGNDIEVFMEFEIDDLNIGMIRSWYFQLKFYDSSTVLTGDITYNGDYANTSTDTIFPMLSGTKGVLSSGKAVIPANTTQIQVTVGVRSFAGGSPVTMRFGRVTYI